MKSRLGQGFVFILFAAPLSFAACGDDDDTSSDNAGGASAGSGSLSMAGAVGSEGALECLVVGELCHEADVGSSPAHDCHELGHTGDAEACASQFAKCLGICVHDDDAGSGGAGSGLDAKCAAIGELCHAVDDGNGPLHDCHELGHEGDAAACAESFEVCATACLTARESLEGLPDGTGGQRSEGGAGGSGGVASAEPAGGGEVGGAGGGK